MTAAFTLSWECFCRAGCSAEEFEGLVQRNMAANCGMDYRAAGEFIASIVCTELKRIQASGISKKQADGRDRSVTCQLAAKAGLPRQNGEGKAATQQDFAQHGHGDAGHACEAEHAAQHSSSDLRIVLTAVLRLRQALPMLEELIAGTLTDDSNSREASNGHDLEIAVHTCEHQQSQASNDCASNWKAAFKFDRRETAMGSLGSVCKKDSSSLNDEQFWQYLQGLRHEVQRCALASKPELHPQQFL